jgi:predicted membrane protein
LEKEMKNETVSNKRILFGLFLIALGVFWILVKLDVIPDTWNDVLISWKMLLIGIGVFSMIGGNRTAGTILIVIGGFFMIPDIVNIPYELRRIGWPLLIIGIGVALLLTYRKGAPIPPQSGNGNQCSVDYFDDFVIFGGREVFVNSNNFLGGKITSIFGGAEYDLRQSRLSENGAVIESVCVFGGSGFKVPPDWSVKNEVTAIFGAFEDKRGMTAHDVITDNSKTLVIKGFCAFGGVEVKYQ